MLQHEQEQPLGTPAAPGVPAAQIRVTSEELAQAINALEASKDAAARHLAGTVPIGEVVQELKLEATPEEVWAQVQKQRAQAAEEEARRIRAAEAVPIVPVVPAAQDARAVRQRARGWRRVARGWEGMKGWLWILFWCSGGLGLVSSVLHPSHSTAAAVSVSGDGQTLTSGTQGRDVAVSGDNDTLTLQGNCPTLTISGDGNHIRVEGTVGLIITGGSRNDVRVEGTVGRAITDGDGNTIVYTRGDAPALAGGGNGNHVEPSKP